MVYCILGREILIMNNYCYYDYQIAHVQQNNSTTAPFPSSAATPKRKPWEPKFVERIFFFFFLLLPHPEYFFCSQVGFGCEHCLVVGFILIVKDWWLSVRLCLVRNAWKRGLNQLWNPCHSRCCTICQLLL